MFSCNVTKLMRYFLIPLSAFALLFGSFQVHHLSTSDRERNILLVSFSNKDIAILPASLKLSSVDFYSLPEILHLEGWDINYPKDAVQSLFVNAYSRNAYYVFTSINAP